MTMNKDSPEVAKFMRLFAKLKDWSEDDPNSLPDLANTDEAIKTLCLELLKAAGILQKNERGDRELFTAPVDSKFISTWRDFEERFADALLIVLSNAAEAGGMRLYSSFDWYEPSGRWEDADYKAAGVAEAIEAMIDFAHTQAERNMEESGTDKIEWIPINTTALPPELKEAWVKVRESSAAAEASRDALIEHLRNELQACDDEARKSALNEMLDEITRQDDGDPMPIEQVVKWAKADWNRLKDEAGFDLRGVFRRRALVPFVLFPRHVAAQHGRAEMLSIYENLRQAHEAFVFGAPFAALALMRSIMENVLRDHYGAQGDGLSLSERINNSSKLLPSRANLAALHHLRRRANAVLHDTERDEALPQLETAQLEREILWLFRVLRALIEGAPSKTSMVG